MLWKKANVDLNPNLGKLLNGAKLPFLHFKNACRIVEKVRNDVCEHWVLVNVRRQAKWKRM